LPANNWSATARWRLLQTSSKKRRLSWIFCSDIGIVSLSNYGLSYGAGGAVDHLHPAIFLLASRCASRDQGKGSGEKAHHKAGDNKPLYLGHPDFEGFEVRQTVRRGKAEVA